MKTKLRIIFLFSLTLVLLPAFAWLVLTGKIAQAFNPSTTDSIIYDESLSSQWQNWSWNTTIDFNATETPNSGNKVLSAVMNGWGGIYFHTDTAVEESTTESIVFSMRTTQDNSHFVVLVYDENNQPIGNAQPITTYGEQPAANVWKTYVIPFPSGKNVKGIAIQDITGRNNNKVLLDTYFLKNKAVPTASPTPLASASPTPVQSQSGLTIFDEGLAANWENWSWGSGLNFNNTSPVASGSKSLAFTAQSGWAGLYLHYNSVIDTAMYANLQFSVNATQANQQFAVGLVNENYQLLANPVPLSNYGAPTQGNWKSYTIPLSDLNATNKKVNGIMIQEVSGQAQPVIYIDALRLSTAGEGTNPNQPTVVPSVTPATTPSASPTPAMVKQFSTLAPGSSLPSAETCAAQVRRSAWEPRPENNQANNTRGIQLTTRIDGSNAEGNQRFLPRINGDFTGTTDEIIQWGACKWGFDEDIVRAVAAQESWWRQAHQGDFNGSDYESYGLMQVRRTYHEGTYPISLQSTPFNVDYALGWRRACYEGHFEWIPAEAKGDEWGCIGLWFSGRWKDGDPNVSHSGANWYIGKVQGYLQSKPWLTQDFIGTSQ